MSHQRQIFNSMPATTKQNFLSSPYKSFLSPYAVFGRMELIVPAASCFSAQPL